MVARFQYVTPGTVYSSSGAMILPETDARIITLYFHPVVRYRIVFIKIIIYVNLKTLTRQELAVKVLPVLATTN